MPRSVSGHEVIAARLATCHRAMPLAVRMRAAIEALPFEKPKLAVTAMVNGGNDFADRLERAIERSGKRPKLIDTKAVETIVP